MSPSNLSTRFTELFHLAFPVMAAPMSRSSGGTIAAAVSNAGGLGTFGAHGGGPEWLREQIRLVKSLTGRAFGVGFIVWDDGIDPEHFAVAMEERVPVFHFSFAEAGRYITDAKSIGSFVISQVQTEQAAVSAVEAGADVLVAQGNEAGGHTGEALRAPLFERIRTMYPNIPVLAAGGISSGRSLGIMLNAGADGASVGTAFLACSDNPDVDEVYRQRVIEGTGDQTVYTDMFDRLSEASGSKPWSAGIAARVLTNKWVERWAGHESEMMQQLDRVLPEYREAGASGDTEMRPLYAGLGVGDVTSVRSAAAIITEMCNEATAMMESGN